MAIASAAVDNGRIIEATRTDSKSGKTKEVARKFFFEAAFFMTWFGSWETGAHLLTKYDLWPWQHDNSNHMPLQLGSIDDSRQYDALKKQAT